jgi:hypothetical protein
MSEVVPLQHDGPKTIAALAAKRIPLADHGQDRTQSYRRTRPIFRRWSAVADFELDETELSLDDLIRIAERAGRLNGIGDARKLGYGRFAAVVKAS